jgi:hypothetical protein
MKEKNLAFNLHFETEGEVGHYEKDRLTSSLEEIIFKLMEKKIYNLKSLKFSISDTKPEKAIKKRNRTHGLFVQHYYDQHEGSDLFFSWNGCRPMNGHSRYLLNEFNKENGIIEYLKIKGYLIETIDFELRTIEKFY